MEALLTPALPEHGKWLFEPKWDGFRCLIFRDGPSIELQSKASKPLTRYFPEVAACVEKIPAKKFVLDGLIAKRTDALYEGGKRSGAVRKIKTIRTADCVVGGFRYSSNGNSLGSLLLGLYDAKGLLNHMGFTSSFTAAERKAMTASFESIIEPPGFTGDAPGGPSRWSTERSAEWKPVRPEVVVEVSYDHFTGGRFRHGTGFLRFRPDKAPKQCKLTQVITEARVVAV